jgi:hypothetical protein
MREYQNLIRFGGGRSISVSHCSCNLEAIYAREGRRVTNEVLYHRPPLRITCAERSIPVFERVPSEAMSGSILGIIRKSPLPSELMLTMLFRGFLVAKARLERINGRIPLAFLPAR